MHFVEFKVNRALDIKQFCNTTANDKSYLFVNTNELATMILE